MHRARHTEARTQAAELKLDPLDYEQPASTRNGRMDSSSEERFKKGPHILQCNKIF